MSGGDLVLSLDQGGQSSRAMVFDRTGRAVAHASVPVRTLHPASEHVEHDPEEVVTSLRTAFDGVAAQLGDRCGAINAAGLATQRSSIVCWDRATGAALSPVISWQDRRAAACIEALVAAGHGEMIRTRTGLVPSPHYGASKLRWCLDHLSAVRQAEQAGRLVMGPLAAFLLFRLLRERPLLVDAVNASRTLLCALSSGAWDDDLLRLFDMPRAALPKCMSNRAAFGSLSIGGRDVPMQVVTGDQPAALFARGRPAADECIVNIGTGAFVQRVLVTAAGDGADAQCAVRLLRGVVWRDDARSILAIEGTVNGAGSALALMRAQLAPALDDDAFAEGLEAALAAPGEPPLFLNGISGLGSPWWLSSFESRFIGEGTPRQRLAAVVESIVFMLAVNIDAMRTIDPPLRAIRLAGGLAQLDGLRHRLADVTGLTVVRSESIEETSRGLAWLLFDSAAAWDNDAANEAPTIPSNDEAISKRFRRWRQEMDRATGCSS